MRRAAIFSLTLFFATLWLSPCATAQETLYKEGSVWDIVLVKTKPGMKNEYLRSLAANWRKIHEEAKTQGLILSYKILSSTAANKQDWDIMLMTEYKGMASLDGYDQKWGALQEKIFGSEAGVTRIYSKQGEMREVLGEKTVREILLK